ncbi:MAG TPA: hypothetical protein VIL99_01125 [Ignavibacteria bacterium]|jgi:hypothetical protein
MFRTKLVALLIVIAALFAISSNLSAKDLPGDKAGRKADYLYKKLGLSIDQYTKTYQAFLAYEFKVEDNMKQFNKDKAACKDACAKAKTALVGELGKVFNKDQATKFETMKDKAIDMKYKKKVRKVKTIEGTEKKDDMKKDVKKEEPKKDVKKVEPKKEEPKKK